MIRTPAQHNTENPPGCIRPPKYLKDVIKRIQGEENSVGALEQHATTLPSTNAEKRLESLVAALERACGIVETESAEQFMPTQPRLRTTLIRKLIREHTASLKENT